MRGPGPIGSAALRLKNEAGTAIVEMAVLLPVLVLIVFGVLDFGRATNYYNDATHLANEGARFAVVNSNPGSGSGKTLQQYILCQADTSEMVTNSKPPNGGVTITFPNGTSNVGDPVEVDVRTKFNWLPYFGNHLGFAAISMTGKAVMRIEQPPTNYSTSDNNPTSC